LTYAFRIRFHRSPTDTVNIDARLLDLPSFGQGQRVQLRARDKGKVIKDSERLVLVGEGFDSEEAATLAGNLYGRVLLRTMAHVRVGADFGDRAPKGSFTKNGLEWLESQRGERILNDVHGMMVFVADPWPKFASTDATALRGAPQDRFERSFRRGLETDVAMTEQERIAFEVFNASFFQPSADARFLLRVMAIEALLAPRPRPDAVLQHVESLIAATEAEPSLPTADRQSLLGSLRWLRQESISRSGRHLAESKLSGRKYQDRSPAQFFSDCYTVRSNMVHGLLPFPTRDEVDRLSAGLELFVADLLSGSLVDVE
jgi:hypothetical protein